MNVVSTVGQTWLFVWTLPLPQGMTVGITQSPYALVFLLYEMSIKLHLIVY